MAFRGSCSSPNDRVAPIVSPRRTMVCGSHKLGGVGSSFRTYRYVLNIENGELGPTKKSAGLSISELATKGRWGGAILNLQGSGWWEVAMEALAFPWSALHMLTTQ